MYSVDAGVFSGSFHGTPSFHEVGCYSKQVIRASTYVRLQESLRSAPPLHSTLTSLESSFTHALSIDAVGKSTLLLLSLCTVLVSG